MTAAKKTPVRSALNPNSFLLNEVKDRLEAVKKKDRKLLADDIKAAFGDSLDIDSTLLKDHEQENRWDYLFGHNVSEQIIAVEPHTAAQHEVEVVIRKRKYAKEQLASHLKSSARISRWLWVTRGKNHFADTEKVRRILDQNGIEFVGKQVLAKHLPKAAPTKKSAKK